MAQKSTLLPNYQKIVLNHIKAASRLYFFVKLKHLLSTIIVSVGIKYSVGDLLFDVTRKVAIWVTYGK